MVEKNFQIIAETGIHARPATLLVQTAGKFSADVQIAFKDKKVNLKSIMAVLGLGANKGADVTIYCDGADEATALEALEATMKTEGLI